MRLPEYGDPNKGLPQNWFQMDPPAGVNIGGLSGLINRPGASPMPARVPGQGTLPSIADLEAERDRELGKAYGPSDTGPSSPFDFKRDVLPAGAIAAALLLLGVKGKYVGEGLQSYAAGKIQSFQAQQEKQRADDEGRRRMALAKAGFVGDRIAARERADEKSADRDREEKQTIESILREDRIRKETQDFQRSMLETKTESAAEKQARASRESWAKNAAGLLDKKRISPEQRSQALGLLDLYKSGAISYAQEQELNRYLGAESYQGASIDSQIKSRGIQSGYTKAKWDELVQTAPERARKLAAEVDAAVARARLTNTEAQRVYDLAHGVGPEFALREAAIQARIAASNRSGGGPTREDLEALISLRKAEQAKLMTDIAQDPISGMAVNAQDLRRVEQDIAAYTQQLNDLLLGKTGNGGAGGSGRGRAGAPAPLPGVLNTNPAVPGGLEVVPSVNPFAGGAAAGSIGANKSKPKAAKKADTSKGSGRPVWKE